jgi:hypothetical protein
LGGCIFVTCAGAIKSQGPVGLSASPAEGTAISHTGTGKRLAVLVSGMESGVESGVESVSAVSPGEGDAVCNAGGEKAILLELVTSSCSLRTISEAGDSAVSLRPSTLISTISEPPLMLIIVSLDTGSPMKSLMAVKKAPCMAASNASTVASSRMSTLIGCSTIGSSVGVTVIGVGAIVEAF